jgi:hypothetical protein
VVVDVDIDSVRSLWESDEYELSEEIITRMAQRDVSLPNLEQCLRSGRIVDERPRSFPYPKCTVQGWADRHVAGLNVGPQLLNVACGVGEVLQLITVYWEGE